MAPTRAVLSGLNIVAKDMNATLAFYRKLGVDIPDTAVWGTSTGAHHITIPLRTPVTMELDSTSLAGVYNTSYDADDVHRTVIGFSLETRDAVDEVFAEMTADGYKGVQTPWDAFWGARYAILEDPEGNHVGIMSPSEEQHRSTPPDI